MAVNLTCCSSTQFLRRIMDTETFTLHCLQHALISFFPSPHQWMNSQRSKPWLKKTSSRQIVPWSKDIVWAVLSFLVTCSWVNLFFCPTCFPKTGVEHEPHPFPNRTFSLGGVLTSFFQRFTQCQCMELTNSCHESTTQFKCQKGKKSKLNKQTTTFFFTAVDAMYHLIKIFSDLENKTKNTT